MTWLALHWFDILIHLGLDLSGGLTLRCLMGCCQHTWHRYTIWVIGAILFSVMTVRVIG